MIRTAQDTNATTVAQLLGFDLVETFDDLPAGFKIRWRNIEDRRGFDECKTLGAMARVYAEDLLRTFA